MENKNPSSPALVSGEAAASIRLRKRNTLYRNHDQANVIEVLNTRLLLRYGREKRCDEGTAIRLDTIMARSLYSRIFSKQQQKILKEALEKRKERLYVK